SSRCLTRSLPPAVAQVRLSRPKRYYHVEMHEVWHDNFDRATYCHSCDPALYADEARSQHQPKPDSGHTFQVVKWLGIIVLAALALLDERQKQSAHVAVKRHRR